MYNAFLSYRLRPCKPRLFRIDAMQEVPVSRLPTVLMRLCVGCDGGEGLLFDFIAGMMLDN